MSLDINGEDLYRDGMNYGRTLYAKDWGELHPDGKPFMSTELTPELLKKLGPEALQLLAARHPQDVLRVLTEVT